MWEFVYNEFLKETINSSFVTYNRDYFDSSYFVGYPYCSYLIVNSLVTKTVYLEVARLKLLVYHREVGIDSNEPWQESP